MLRETLVLDEDERSDAVGAGTQRLVLVVRTGWQVGQRFLLRDGRQSIGRDPEADLTLLDEGVSRHHATIELHEGRVHLTDLGSTNGSFVNGERRTSAELVPGDKIGIGAETILKLTVEDDLDEALERDLVSAATFDALTGAFNRGVFDRELAAEVARALRHDSALALLMFDLDHFKALNDVHGHPVGDAVLREFVARLRSVTRSEDSLARIGGEEFALICVGTTGAEARGLAERALAAIGSATFRVGGLDLDVSTSIGVAELREAAEATPRGLLEAADAALYRAKRAGRGRVESAA